MIRVFWRSLWEPLRSPGSALTLIAAVIILWFTVWVFVFVGADFEGAIPWLAGAITQLIALFMFIPILVLALPIIAAEAKDRTLLLNLLQPIGRAEYFTGRVLGRAVFALLYFLVALGGMFLEITLIQRVVFPAGSSPFPPDISWTLVFTGLSLMTVVVSLAALAPVSSSRFGHVTYWSGLFIIVLQARDLAELPQASALERGFATMVLEVLQPLLVGPAPDFIAEAALGGWYLQRALLQWGFGLSLAYLLGIFAFSKMEVGLRA